MNFIFVVVYSDWRALFILRIGAAASPEILEICHVQGDRPFLHNGRSPISGKTWCRQIPEKLGYGNGRSPISTSPPASTSTSMFMTLLWASDVGHEVYQRPAL